MGVKRYDEATESFWIEHLCTRADSIYRLAFALTLNLDDARACVEKAFASLLGDIAAVQRASNPLVPLAKACVEAFSKHKAIGKGGSSKLISLMRTMNPEVRGALVAVDGIGLLPREAAEVFGVQEKQLRESLAEGRRRLVSDDARL